ncbi:MAG TPA: OmpA family protein [bacterium]|nr:OmpA family protein [bacterium]
MGLNCGNRLIFLILFVFIFPFAAFCANDFGTAAAQFLKIIPEAAPAGMGESYTGIADDSAALFFNPAGLALVDKTELSATQLLWFNDINMTHIGYVMPLEYGTGLGFSLIWIDFGDFDSTGIPGMETSARNAVLSAGFGKSIGDIFALGLNAKGIYESFVDETDFGVSFDAGAIIKLMDRNLALGIAVKNLGFVAGTSDSLPMEVSAGLGIRLFTGSHDYFNIGIDASKVLVTDNMFLGAGIEGTLFKALTLRAGFRYNNALDLDSMDFSDIKDMIMFSAGAGININDFFMIDYAYTPMGDLGQVQRIGVKLKFGESKYENMLAERNAEIVPRAIEIPNVDVEGGRIKAVSFRPNIPQETVKEWSLNIKNSEGEIVKTFSGIGEVPKNLSWDGTDRFGMIAGAETNYIFDFKAKDLEGQVIKSIGHIIKPKEAGYIKIEDKRFIPERGREMLVAPVTLLVSSDTAERRQVPFVMENTAIIKAASWAFEIFDGGGSLIRTFKGKGAMPSYLVWDGKNLDGRYVDNLKSCRYVLTVHGTDGKKARITEKKVVREPFVIVSRTKQLKMAEKIYFEAGSFDLHPEMEKRLAETAREINSFSRAQIYIQGHSSREGDRSFNLRLSQERAKAVLRLLVEKYKVSPLSITTVGYGAAVPSDTAAGEDALARNRRVEIIIMGETGDK